MAVLQDTNGILWYLGVDSVGRIKVTSVVGATSTLISINDSNNSTTWQLTISTTGRLITTSATLNPVYTTFVPLLDPNAVFYALTDTTLGILQTHATDSVWVPNGFGAGRDNSVIGALGGFMAYPQPPEGTDASFSPPEDYGQFEAFTFTATAAMLNWFTMQNPGRSD